MKIIAIIPIKHNSERVPGKNYKLFCGKPLYRYILDTIVGINMIDKIVVDTNSPIIKEGVKKYYKNILIYNRPEELCSGDTPVNKLLINVINDLKLDADIYLQTHTTNPLLKIETIISAINKFKDLESKGYDSLFTVKEWKTRLYNKECSAINHNINELIPTQNLEPLYEENSCLYLFKKDVLFNRNHRIGNKPLKYIMDDIESQDIDIPSDFVIAEILYKNLYMNKNKIVLITGINGGIGSELALYYKTHNWNIVGTDIHEKCNHLSCDLYIEADFNDKTSFKNIINKIENKYNRLDCIINNAAVQINKKVWEYTDNEWEKTFSCNFKPLYKFIEYSLELLKKSKGNIINIGSIHHTCTSDSIGAYSASKSAVVGLTKNLAIELAEYGIRVNTISPGAVKTNMLIRSLTERAKDDLESKTIIDNFKKKHILGNIGETEDISQLVYSICNNNFMTGGNIIIDGGVSIKLSTE
jgi:CMP-N-acetylneuraminic acid synthetase/NAD(P)-dependent dehydrogenase (short-subunit alcohol dehydrogenase family)